jgi:glucosamine--fructose-6-phosphate aminotransferase (isomerizing)
VGTRSIDLSSNPCRCLRRRGLPVIGDIVKDTAIFKAHKAPVVICDGENSSGRMRRTSSSKVGEHLAPILNTLVGHLWGYYAALSIHEVHASSSVSTRASSEPSATPPARSRHVRTGPGKGLPGQIAEFCAEFTAAEKQFPSPWADAGSDLMLLLKYLAGRLPASDFELTRPEGRPPT